MDNEKLYDVIKNTLYGKFNELEEIEHNDDNYVYLRYKNDDYSQILIDKKMGEVYYYSGFRNNILKLIPMEKLEFETLLSRWIKDTFQIKVNDILGFLRAGHARRLEIPFKYWR